VSEVVSCLQRSGCTGRALIHGHTRTHEPELPHRVDSAAREADARAVLSQHVNCVGVMSRQCGTSGASKKAKGSRVITRWPSFRIDGREAGLDG
jgi:hypothetical protein